MFVEAVVKRTLVTVWFVVSILTTLSACGPQEAKPLAVNHAWSRYCIKGAVCGAYFTIDNSGGSADTLVSGTTGVCNSVEVHRSMKHPGGMVTMKQQDNVPVPAGKVVEFKPGDYHIMLIGMKQDLKVGDTFTLTLKFQTAGDITVQARVREDE